MRETTIVLTAENTKTACRRALPITPRLRAVRNLLRIGPDAREYAPDRYVFGNECGERIKRIRHAWDNTCRGQGSGT